MAKKKKTQSPQKAGEKQEEVKEVQMGEIAVLVGGSIPDWLKQATDYGLLDMEGIVDPAVFILSRDPTLSGYSSVYQLYRVMEGDYSGLLQSRISAVLTKPRLLNPPANGGAKAQEAFKLAQEAINRLDVDSILSGIWEAIPRGFSVIGNTYASTVGNIYPSGGRIELVESRPYPQELFVFKKDGSLWLKAHGQAERELPPANFIVTRHYLTPSDRFYNPYGRGLNCDCFKSWLITDYVVRFWGNYAEKFAGQMTVVYYDNDDNKEQALLLAQKIVNSLGVALPKGSEVKFPTPDRRASSEVFSALIDYCEKRKAIVILGQSESTEPSPGRLGNSNLSKDVKDEIQKSDCKVVFGAFTQGVLGNWLRLQLGEDVPLPTFEAEIIEPEDDLSNAQVDRILVRDLGVKYDDEYWYKKYRKPPPPEGPTVVPPVNPLLGFSESGKYENPATIKKNPAFGGAKAGGRGNKMKAEVFKKGLPLILAGFSALTGAVAEEIELATDYDDASRRLDVLLGAGAPPPEVMGNALLTLRLNANLGARANIQKQMTGWFIPPMMPEAGFAEDDEYEKAQSYIKSRELIEGQVPGGLSPEDFHFVTPEKALEFWATKIPITGAEFDALVGAERLEAFSVAGVESTRLLEQMKSALGDSLAKGEVFLDFQDRVQNIFDDVGITQLSSGHLQLVYENNIGTAYEMGNYASLHDDLAVQLFPYLQYLTMDDPDVRENHQAMHRKVFRRDDPIWNTWWPLNGHRCRCTVVGLMKEEGEAIGISDRATILVMPDPGFESGPGYLWAA